MEIDLKKKEKKRQRAGDQQVCRPCLDRGDLISEKIEKLIDSPRYGFPAATFESLAVSSSEQLSSQLMSVIDRF